MSFKASGVEVLVHLNVTLSWLLAGVVEKVTVACHNPICTMSKVAGMGHHGEVTTGPPQRQHRGTSA